MGAAKVSGLPNRVKATDEELLACYKKGEFLDQIRKKYITGRSRLQKITRAYDAMQQQGRESL